MHDSMQTERACSNTMTRHRSEESIRVHTGKIAVTPRTIIDSISSSDIWRTFDCQNRLGASQNSLYALGLSSDDGFIFFRNSAKFCFSSAGAAGCG